MNPSHSSPTQVPGLDELLQKRPWVDLNNKLQNEPVGMLGTSEAMLFYYLAKDVFQGCGTIVDAGSFLGKSAYFLAEGLRANRNYVPQRDKIHCFDNFLVNEAATVQFIETKLNRTMAVGDSTRELFEAQVSSVAEMLEVHEGDFHVASWPSLPIEILMVDIAKSPELGRRVVEIFFPSLVPGKSFVIQQDYHHPWLPHIHVTMEYLSEYFDLIVPRADDSAVFLYRAAVPPEKLRRLVDFDFSHEEQLELMDRAIARLPPEDQFYVRIARIVLQFKKVHEDILRGELDSLRQQLLESGQDYSANPYFEEVAVTLDELEGWRSNGEGNYSRCLELADKVLVRRRNMYNMSMRGHALLGLQRNEEAEAQLRLALTFRSPSGYVWIALAQSLLNQRKWVEAETELLRGIRDYDTHVHLQYYLGVLTWIWRLEEPRRDRTAVMAELNKRFSGAPEYWVLDAWTHILEDDPESAKASMRRAAELGLVPERVAELRQEMQLPPLPERPWCDISLPSSILQMKSMLSDDEKQYFTWLTSDKYEGWGAIVELGAWLGSGSAALAEGLRRRGSTATIHSFDRFVWEPYMAATAGEDLKQGEDFQHLFHRQTREYAPWIASRKVDLMQHSWEGGPIELLVVDSAKTWELTNAILRDFGPYLIPGRSRVVLQDFRYGYAYCLPLIFDSRPDIWKQVEDVEFGVTVTFIPQKPLFGPDGIDSNYSEESFSLAAATELLRSRMEREKPHNRWQFIQGLYRRHLIDGSISEISRLREEVIAAGIDDAELRRIEDIGFLLDRGWTAYNAGDYQTARAIAERCVALPAPATVHTLMLLAFSCLRLGDREAAVHAIEKAEQLDPNYLPAKFFRAELAIADGHPAETETQLTSLIEREKLDESMREWAQNLLTTARQQIQTQQESLAREQNQTQQPAAQV